MPMRMMFNVFQHDYIQNFQVDATTQICKQFPKFCDRGITKNPEIVLTDSVSLKNQFKNKKILVVGGGPSINRINWEPTYDSLWTMNKFYMDQRLFSLRFDMVHLQNPNFQDTNLIMYLKRFRPIILFEPHKRWESKGGFWEKWEFSLYSVAYLTRFYSKLGVGVRLMILGAFLGAAQIDFIGIGDVEDLIRGHHGFEKNKSDFPSGTNIKNIRRIFKKQYQEFFSYMNEKFPNTILNALDKENPYVT